MISFVKLLGWQFLILYKNNLINISIIVTVMYALIFFLIKDFPNVDKFLTLLIFNDPAIIGLFFVGLSIIMEKNDEVLPALFVTPMNSHFYLLSKVVALSIIGWACAAGMAMALLGLDILWLHFSVGVFTTCFIFSLAGIFVVSFTTEFLNFMLRSIPIMLLLALPLLNYFGLTDLAIFRLLPIQGPLTLIVHSIEKSFDLTTILISYVGIIFWILLLYYGVFLLFNQRIIKAN